MNISSSTYPISSDLLEDIDDFLSRNRTIIIKVIKDKYQ